MYMRVHVYPCLHVWLPACMYACVCMYAGCVCVCALSMLCLFYMHVCKGMYACVYMYYMHTHIHTGLAAIVVPTYFHETTHGLIMCKGSLSESRLSLSSAILAAGTPVVRCMHL